MACSAPRDCGNCAGCQQASVEYEAKLDRVQTLIEERMQPIATGVAVSAEDVEYAAAGIVNELVREGWLKLKAIPA